MQELVRIFLLILALTACGPLAGAEGTLPADGTSHSSADSSLVADPATTTTATQIITNTPAPSTPDTSPILMETATAAATMTPQPTATGTFAATATATPTALLLASPYAIIPPDWQVYQNEVYGFTFSYPPTWTLTMPSGNSAETPALFLELQHPGASLSISLKEITAVDTHLGPTGIAAGDLFEGGTVHFFEQQLPTIQLIYENQLKGMFYGRVGGEIVIDHLAFFIALSGDHEARYIEVNLDPAVVNEVVQILATFQFLEQTQ